MKLVINYEASWRNSFLDPSTSNNEPLPKTGRKFMSSMTNLKDASNFIERDVSLDTVMGVLNRLIGDQRKLYQSRASGDYYFRSIEPKVIFQDNIKTKNSELVFLRNVSGSTDQNSYSGMIRTNDPIFSSDYSKALWSILALDIDQLCTEIVSGELTNFNQDIELNPLSIISRLEYLNSLKPLPMEEHVAEAHEYLSSKFEKFKGVNKNGLALPISLYCCGLYLQLSRLSKKYDVESAKTKAGGLSGISNNGFTKKDFMSRYTTGDKKKIWGNPYMREEFIKGEGKDKKMLKKASGKLEIHLGVEKEKGKEIDEMIKAAGVSSFYLGKKGLAYVSDIRI